MSSVTRSTVPARSKVPGPKKGIQRRKASDAKPPTPVFVPRNTIADPKVPRANTRARATCANPNCPKPEIVDDDGTKVCVTCGTVAQESNIVSEITFGESSTGAAVVQGTFVGEGQRHGRGGLGPRGFHGSDDSPNRAQTLMLAKNTVSGLVTKLGLPQNLTEQAAHIFQISQYQMVQGRSIRAVAAVCLYVACRRRQAVEAHHIMLIDIAEHMNFNVFMLGSVYTKMVRKVHGLGDIEAVNPENLILRFARSLEFGRDTNRIVTEATRIVQRMKRDWMVTGRRPAGICGAALIIAARMNNFRRTVREMVYVVKVTEITINKRLEEFKVTEASKFTVDAFRTTDLNALKEHDPPAFYRAQQGPKTKKQRGRKRKADEAETAAEIEGDEEDEDEDEAATPPPTQKRRIDKDGFAIPDIPIDPALRSASPAIDPNLTSAVNDAISEMERDQSLRVDVEDDDTASIASTDTSATDSTTISETTGLPRKKRGRPKGAKNKGPLPLSEAELALEEAIEGEVQEGLDKISKDPEASREASRLRERESNSVQPQQQPPMPTPPNTQPMSQPAAGGLHVPQDVPMTEDIDPSEFDNDPEVANCLLSPAEQAIKERIWTHENNTWLREQHRKKIQAQLKNEGLDQAAIDAQNAKSRKNRRPRLGDPKYLKKNSEGGGDKENTGGDDEAQADNTEGEGAEEAPDDADDDPERAAGRAVKSMLENRAYSTRINYNVMQTLFPGMMDGESKMESRRSADEKARKREKQLAAGVTPGTSAAPSEAGDDNSRAESPVTAALSTASSPRSAAPGPAVIKSSTSSPTKQLSPSGSRVVEPPAEDEEEEGSDVDVNIMGDLGSDDEDDEDDPEEAFAGRYQGRGYDEDDDDEE